ncbi:MAG: hypothetical protein HDQ88_09400 [Clostridia bacterium]|nr:hypothetical protein [Clostridia bacterium]
MTTPEGKIKTKVKAILESLGDKCWYFMPVQRGLGCKRGVPDFIVCAGGLFVGVETKAGNNKRTTIQKYVGDRIELAGGAVIVVNEDTLDAFEQAMQVWVSDESDGESCSIS